MKNLDDTVTLATEEDEDAVADLLDEEDVPQGEASASPPPEEKAPEAGGDRYLTMEVLQDLGFIYDRSMGTDFRPIYHRTIVAEREVSFRLRMVKANQHGWNAVLISNVRNNVTQISLGRFVMESTLATLLAGLAARDGV